MGGGGDQGGWVDLSSPLESSKFHQEPQEDLELEFAFSLLDLLLLLSYSLDAPILPFWNKNIYYVQLCVGSTYI